MAREDIARLYTKPGASTYGGNPVACVAALATIGHHKAMNLGQAARDRGAELRAGLDRMHADFPTTTGTPRGMGLMQAMPIVNGQRSPDPIECDRVLEGLKDKGVLAGKTGVDRNVLTFLPPLTISSQEILHVVESLESVL
jgi:4-aminobutyrate aminotransferase